jgi:hypothetical protein
VAAKVFADGSVTNAETGLETWVSIGLGIRVESSSCHSAAAVEKTRAIEVD